METVREGVLSIPDVIINTDSERNRLALDSNCLQRLVKSGDSQLRFMLILESFEDLIEHHREQ